MSAIGREAAPRAARPPAGNPDAPLARRSPYGRWRALSLLLVYVLIAAHVVHWRLTGRTLAPLELHEVMYTLELGVVTAGFLFMALAVLATAFFGRFFCGWGCHMMALQELAAWLLAKAGIRAKPVRSRVLAWAPAAVLLYMFAWPQVQRVAAGRPFPPLRIAQDADGWASFATTDFWRNLPGPWVTGLTFLVCGFLIVYVLGSRGFCASACPYGALFGWVERLAPGRIRVNDRCVQCGTCSAVCSSGILVHEEVKRHGMVVDPLCMKDLDCVGSCPEGALAWRLGRPPALRRMPPARNETRRFRVGEELIVAAVFLLTLMVFRGLYEQVPFLMAVGLGAITAYSTLVLVRLFRQGEVLLGRVVLRRAGRLRTPGRLFAAAMGLYVAFWGHSAFVQWSRSRARSAWEQACARPAGSAAQLAAARLAQDRLSALERASLFPMVETKVLLGWVGAMLGDAASAEGRLREALAVDPRCADAHYWLAGFLAKRQEWDAAIDHLRQAVHWLPGHAQAHHRLGLLLRERGREAEADRHLAEAVRLDPSLGRAGGR